MSGDQPLVYFGSFQDLLGRDRATGNIKARNESIHLTDWDLVVFDEAHRLTPTAASYYQVSSQG